MSRSICFGIRTLFGEIFCLGGLSLISFFLRSFQRKYFGTNKILLPMTCLSNLLFFDDEVIEFNFLTFGCSIVKEFFVAFSMFILIELLFGGQSLSWVRFGSIGYLQFGIGDRGKKCVCLDNRIDLKLFIFVDPDVGLQKLGQSECTSVKRLEYSFSMRDCLSLNSI